MKISAKQLKNGVEVDMPMLEGNTQTRFAVRWDGDRFQIYDFTNGGIMLSSDSLEIVVNEANRVFGTKDIATA